MKVPPKRKGNLKDFLEMLILSLSLNESPSEKEGKYFFSRPGHGKIFTLNESPSEKEGK